MEWDFAQEIIKLQNKSKEQDKLIEQLVEKSKRLEGQCDDLSNKLAEANKLISSLQGRVSALESNRP